MADRAFPPAFSEIAERGWYPQVPLAIGMVVLALIQFGSFAAQLIHGGIGLHNVLDVSREVWSSLLTGAHRIVTGMFLLTMAHGILKMSRLAWIIVTGILLLNFVGLMLQPGPSSFVSAIIQLVLLAGLWRYRGRFNQSNLATATAFSIGSVVLLMLYAVLGSYHLGRDFSPPIDDLGTAVYFSIVTMTTVGYGDIEPQTMRAQWFVVSMILLGITVFATAVSTVLAPIVSTRLHELVTGKVRKVDRKDHHVIIGDGPLALAGCRELLARGQHVVLVGETDSLEASDALDIVPGDPSDHAVLGKTDIATARAVLLLGGDDAQNAFVMLAVKETGTSARTVIAVNDAHHLDRIRQLGPDQIIAPMSVAGQVLARALTGEETHNSDILSELLSPGRS